jgi:hypothetical protein
VFVLNVCAKTDFRTVSGTSFAFDGLFYDAAQKKSGRLRHVLRKSVNATLAVALF